MSIHHYWIVIDYSVVYMWENLRIRCTSLNATLCLCSRYIFSTFSENLSWANCVLLRRGRLDRVSRVLTESSHAGINVFNTSSWIALFFCLADVFEFEADVDERLDGVPVSESGVVIFTRIPARGAFTLARQRATLAYIDREVHVAFDIFIASATGTLYLVAYTMDLGSAAGEK